MSYTIPQLQHLDDEYETISIRIGQKIKFFDNTNNVSYGTVLSADVVNGTIDIVTGNIIQWKETVHIDDLIEG